MVFPSQKMAHYVYDIILYTLYNIIYIIYRLIERKKERQQKTQQSRSTVPSPQEFMILPVGAASFREALQIGAEVWLS